MLGGEVVVRRPARFTTADLTRAIKAAVRAGLSIGYVRIEPNGSILIVPSKPDVVATCSRPDNPWDAS
jgi:hypothetical protein